MIEPKVDPAAEALRLADEAKQFISGTQQGDTILALAQVYVGLALVEKLTEWLVEIKWIANSVNGIEINTRMR